MTSDKPQVPGQESWHAGRKAAFTWFAAHGHGLVLELIRQRTQNAQAVYERSADGDARSEAEIAMVAFSRGFAHELASLLRDEVRS